MIISHPPADALVSARDGKSNGVQEKVLSTLLNEMDGVGVRVDAGASAKVGRISGGLDQTPRNRDPDLGYPNG